MARCVDKGGNDGVVSVSGAREGSGKGGPSMGLKWPRGGGDVKVEDDRDSRAVLASWWARELPGISQCPPTQWT